MAFVDVEYGGGGTPKGYHEKRNVSNGTYTVNCGFRPKHITLKISSETSLIINGHMYYYDEDYSSTQQLDTNLGTSAGTTNLISLGGSTGIASVNDNGFVFKYDASATRYATIIATE